MLAPTQSVPIPLSGAKWATKSEAYASLISEHLSPSTVWLDAGCGSGILENDLEPLEDWLTDHCRWVLGLDLAASSNRNIKSLVQGSLYHMPFAANSLDLITCRNVVEHLKWPGKAFTEIGRCLRPGGAFVLITPNLLNYGILGNAVASKILPEKLRLRIVHASDSRSDDDIFPTQYKANTMSRLVRLLNASGMQVHEAVALRQHRTYFRRFAFLEKVLMRLTPHSVFLICAHKV